MTIHQFPLRPSAYQAQQQTILDKIREMGFTQGLVIVTTADGYPVVFVDPNLSVGNALHLMEHTKLRLMGRPPPAPIPPSPA